MWIKQNWKAFTSYPKLSQNLVLDPFDSLMHQLMITNTNRKQLIWFALRQNIELDWVASLSPFQRLLFFTLACVILAYAP